MKVLCQVCVTVLLMLWVSASAGATVADIGKVTVLRGHATVRRPGQETGTSAVKGSSVRVGDVLATGPDGLCQFALTDDSFITLAGESAVRVNQYSFDASSDRRTAVIQLLAGKARFVIFRSRTGGSRFRVETETAAIDPNMTADFVVTVKADDTVVAVLEQGLRIRNRSTLYVGEVRLSGDQRTSVSRGKPPLRPDFYSHGERKKMLSEFRN